MNSSDGKIVDHNDGGEFCDCNKGESTFNEVVAISIVFVHFDYSFIH